MIYVHLYHAKLLNSFSFKIVFIINWDMRVLSMATGTSATEAGTIEAPTPECTLGREKV